MELLFEAVGSLAEYYRACGTVAVLMRVVVNYFIGIDP